MSAWAWLALGVCVVAMAVVVAAAMVSSEMGRRERARYGEDR